jgi:pimeloyl-ACP methyl ester carboxylesterase
MRAGARRTEPRARGAVLCASLLVVLAACATPVGVEREDAKRVHRELTANVLSTGRASERSLQALERLGLRAAFEKSPEEALARLHEGLARVGDDGRLAALAELSFLHASRSGDRRHFVASALYAYALLFPGREDGAVDPSDPRYRLAFDLYNRGLLEGLEGSGALQPGVHEVELPFGALQIEMPEEELLFAGYRLTGFAVAADYAVRGIRNRYRRPGIGAPLSAILAPGAGSLPPGAERLLPGLRVAATALLRIEEPRAGITVGRLRGRVEIATTDESLSVAIDGREVPLELETTSSLAATLAESPLWDFELRGFFSGTLRPFQTLLAGSGPTQGSVEENRLLFLHPYHPGRVPVVLVHGTASSPGRWADLVNELENDRAIADRYQVWLFLYNTGNPIGYSGGLFRRALESAVAELDPEGTDSALRRMVVIGHSQGGLLAKLTAVESGDRFWRNVSDEPLDALDLSPEVRETLRASLFFAPEPFVRRVVFVCTPHRGSYLAGLSLARVVSDLVALPSNVTQIGAELGTRNQGRLALRRLDRLPTSIDNMTPGNPFLRTLAELPVAPGIHAHSVVAVTGEGPPEGGSDGVVRYASAHVEPVDSELVVRSSHSAQGLPATIEEIRRILLEHAAEAEGAR